MPGSRVRVPPFPAEYGTPDRATRPYPRSCVPSGCIAPTCRTPSTCPARKPPIVHAELEGSLNSRVSLPSPAAQKYVAVSVFNHSAVLAWTLRRRTARSRKHLPCRATRQMRWLWCVLATEQHRGQRRACSHKSRPSHAAQPTLVEAVGKRMRRSKCGAKGAEIVAVARRKPRGVPKKGH